MNESTIHIKPMSVNKVWQGKKFRTTEYVRYQQDVNGLLPRRLDIDFSKKLSISLVFGLSSTLNDIDNPIKPFLDILQYRYGFNDKQVYELHARKEIVKKGKEFITFKIKELAE